MCYSDRKTCLDALHKNLGLQPRHRGLVFLFFYFSPFFGIASCVGTAGTVHDAALLYSSRAGSDLGQTLDRFEELCQILRRDSDPP